MEKGNIFYISLFFIFVILKYKNNKKKSHISNNRHTIPHKVIICGVVKNVEKNIVLNNHLRFISIFD